MNVKYLVSYAGLVPFFYLLLDGYFFEYLETNFILDISILMACIIFTFIGAYNWDFKKDNMLLELYGFLPSLISMVILLLNLVSFDKIDLINILILFFLVQLFIDLFFSLRDIFPMRYYIRLRIPVTTSLCASLIFLSNLI